MSYIPHPGNLHDPNWISVARWGCGHKTPVFHSKGAITEQIVSDHPCADCWLRMHPVLDPIVPSKENGPESEALSR